MSWSTFKIEDLTAQQIETWHRLHEKENALRSPFTTVGFCQAVHKVHGNVFVSMLESKGKIQAVFPFERCHGLIAGIARKPGGHLSDCFGIIGGSGYPMSEQDVLRSAHLSVLSFDHVPLQQNGLFPVGRGVVSHGVRIEIPRFDDYLANLRCTNRKFVKEVERHRDQLVQQCGPISFQWQTSRPGAELEKLIDRKRSQYIKSASRDALRPPWARDLLAELLNAQHKNCEAILSTLYCGETWVASNLSLRAGELLHIWFPVFNRDLRRFGPGHILFFKLFESAVAQGVRVIDFGGGVAAYKKKYAGQEYPLFKGCLRRLDVLSAAHRIAQSLSWRIQPILPKWPRGTME